MAKFKRGDRVMVVGTHTFNTGLTKGMLCTVAGTRAGVTLLIDNAHCERVWSWPASGVGLRLCNITAKQRTYWRIIDSNADMACEIERRECEKILASNVEFFSAA
jgi:hypothetical protein